MSDKITRTTEQKLKDYIQNDEVQQKFKQILNDNPNAFLVSILNTVQNSYALQKCEPQSILMAGAVAGTLGLPVDPSLGMAYIIPYGRKAQFQIGYKGLIQLGHRTQQYNRLNVTEVKENEYQGINRMTGEMEFDWIQDNDDWESKPTIGFVAFFRLTNGFEKSLYMTNQQVHNHAKKYSKAFNKPDAPWNTDFKAMAKKTVLKLLIDKWSPKSVEMNKAIKTDQATIHDWDGNLLSYPDNPRNGRVETPAEAEARQQRENIVAHIKNSQDVDKLETCYEHIPDDDVRELYNQKLEELKSKK